MPRTLPALFVVAFIAVAARADSDGSFCAGRSYLAYELRAAGTHTLVVLREAQLEQVEVALPDFQVHGMRCGDDVVELAGWDVTYAVELSSGRHRVSVTPLAKAGALPDWPQTNLATRNTGVTVVDLPWRVPHQLRIEVAPGPATCVSNVATRLYRTGTAAPVRTLLARTFNAECGE